jgi:hypothetical protein
VCVCVCVCVCISDRKKEDLVPCLVQVVKHVCNAIMRVFVAHQVCAVLVFLYEKFFEWRVFVAREVCAVPTNSEKVSVPVHFPYIVTILRSFFFVENGDL